MGRKKKNSEALEELVKSNFLSSLKEEYIRHLTAKTFMVLLNLLSF